MTPEERIAHWEDRADEAHRLYTRLAERYHDRATNENYAALLAEMNAAHATWIAAEGNFDAAMADANRVEASNEM